MFFPGILQGYPIIGNTSSILMELDMLPSSLSNTGLETGSFANKKSYWSLMKVFPRLPTVTGPPSILVASGASEAVAYTIIW